MADLGDIGIIAEFSDTYLAEELVPLVFPDIAIPVPGGTTTPSTGAAGTVTFS